MTATRTLEVENLTLGYRDLTVIESLDLDVPPGKVTAIVGANACGKSTLLRSLSRLLAPRTGRVLLDGKEVHRLPAKELARTLGLLPQSPIAPEGITVADLVGRGRHPHQSIFSRWSRDDDMAVAAALDATQTTALADRPVDELSGGQRQRVWIAMALAQQTDLLLLDEPTTFLDVSHQIEVLDLLTDLNRTRGTTIVMVLHDLNLAARYADHLIALASGRLHASGEPAQVLSVETVRDVFGLESQVIVDPTSGKPLMVPIGRHHMARPVHEDACEPSPASSPTTRSDGMKPLEVPQRVTDRAQLRTVYREPGQRVIDKVIDHIDDGAANFIAHAPFMALATYREGRADASPRGGPPGFVRLLDRHHLAWGDLTGNNRLDSFGNLLEQPYVGLLFIVPGVVETLRVTGTAELTQNNGILEVCPIDGRIPKAAVVVTVQECYIQCGAALRRGEMWDPATWPSDHAKPRGAAILKEHIGTSQSADEIEANLADYYDNHIWAAGGRHD